MVISAEPLIYGLIFVAVLVLVEGIYLTVFGKSISLNNRVNRRLDMLEKGKAREQVLEQLRKEMGQHLKSQKIPLYSILAKKAQLANIAFTPTQLMIVMVVLGGTGSITGAAIVAAALTLFTEVLRPVEEAAGIFGASQIIVALAVLLVLIYRPAGLFGTAEPNLFAWIGRLVSRSKTPAGSAG